MSAAVMMAEVKERARIKPVTAMSGMDLNDSKLQSCKLFLPGGVSRLSKCQVRGFSGFC